MSDIIERLKENGCDCQCRANVELEAAAEIAQLNAELRECSLFIGVVSQYFSEHQIAAWSKEAEALRGESGE
jgi:hypothetical protein